MVTTPLRVTVSGNRTRLMACSNIPARRKAEGANDTIGGSMFVLSNFLVAVAKILDIALSLYMWIIIGRAVISWVNPDPYNPIVRFLNSVTEPVLYPIRRRLPLHFGGIDFSPIIVILAIIFAQSFLIQTLYQVAARMSG